MSTSYNAKDEPDIYLQGLLEMHEVERKTNPTNAIMQRKNSCSFLHLC